MSIVLSIDAMGGDHGINVTIPACLKFLKDYPSVQIILVGNRDAIYKKIGSNLSEFSDRLDVIHATEVVDMDEPPQSAMRNKKDSSMRVSINLIKEKKANAIVSAGNTGALMAIARYVLRTMPSIERPAIAKILPTMSHDVCMLDLGANVECTPEHLLQFGIMGSQLMRAVLQKQSPSIGLLNIGSEDIKGNDVIKKTSQLLRQSGLNFYGNIEGDDINKGTVDVVVCDGFTGNVALKTMEGMAKMLSYSIKRELTQNIFTKTLSLFAMPALNKVKEKLNPSKYNGAVLLGLNGLVIKSHGGADELGFYYALLQAYHEVQDGVIVLLEDYLNKHKQVIEQEELKKEFLEFRDLSQL
jgi:glycerol-3-phosphate acyltransferase PlsX